MFTNLAILGAPHCSCQKGPNETLKNSNLWDLSHRSLGKIAAAKIPRRPIIVIRSELLATYNLGWSSTEEYIAVFHNIISYPHSPWNHVEYPIFRRMKHFWLVLWNHGILFSHSVGNLIIIQLTNSIIFQRGRAQPPTSHYKPSLIIIKSPLLSKPATK